MAQDNETSKLPDSISLPEEIHPVLFEIRILETEVTTGSLPVTWCVDPKWLSECDDKEQYVLLATISTEPGKSLAEWRGWAKLTDLMSYVIFYRPGKNRIVAKITSNKKIVEMWMAREYGGGWRLESVVTEGMGEVEKLYTLASFWNHSENFWNHSENLWNFVDIDLPDNCFAKEPSKLEKKWVDFFFRQKAVDQCEFRRRRILAYTVQPFALIIAAIIYLVVVSVIHLLGLTIGMWFVWEDLFTFDTRVNERINFLKIKRLGRFNCVLGAMPWACIISICIYLKTHTVLFLFIPIIFPLVVAIVFFIILTANTACNFFDHILNKKKSKTPWDLYKLEMSKIEPFLICSSSQKINKIKDLPKNKRTISLRFQGIKARVCRPYAK